MAHLIDKDALVAKIKRLIEIFTNSQYSCEYNDAKADACREFLSLLDTIEVKEVDLDNELDFVKDAYYYFTSDERNSIKKVAKHFFELGLSASNQITAADRGIADEIIFALKAFGDEKMISYDKEIEWLRNKVKKGE